MKNLFLIAAFATLTFSAVAQTVKNKIDNAKIAFISTRLNLDEQTATKFWPIYNQYTQELQAANRERKEHTDALDKPNASDAELEKSINSMLGAQQKALDVTKKFKVEFLRVLSAKQLAELFKLERDFKQKLVQRANGAAVGSDAAPSAPGAGRPRGARPGMRR
jgi:Spy/CpxP family protein refolding chaperone